MTRELIFLNTFEPQFAAFTGWKSLTAVETGARTTGAAAPLAPSDLPGFEIIPGEAKYDAPDLFAFPRTGTQAFTIKVLFSHYQLAVTPLRTLRAGFVSLLETFFSGGYLPPVTAPGDMARIDSVQLLTIAPAILGKTKTRSSITVQAAYHFTIL